MWYTNLKGKVRSYASRPRLPPRSARALGRGSPRAENFVGFQRPDRVSGRPYTLEKFRARRPSSEPACTIAVVGTPRPPRSRTAVNARTHYRHCCPSAAIGSASVSPSTEQLRVARSTRSRVSCPLGACRLPPHDDMVLLEHLACPRGKEGLARPSLSARHVPIVTEQVRRHKRPATAKPSGPQRAQQRDGHHLLSLGLVR